MKGIKNLDHQTITQEDTIWVVTDEAPESLEPDGSRGWRVRLEIPGQKQVAINANKLQNEMEQFLNVVGRLFSQVERQQTETKPKMHLDEIELSVEISGEGQVLLIGSGAKASSKGAIKLKFKRAEST